MARPQGPIKNQILDSAEHLFAEHGFDGVSVRSIAAEAGTTQALLSYHFGSKLDLYHAMWARWYPAPPMLPRPDPDQDRETQLRALIHEFFTGPLRLRELPIGPIILKILGRELYDPKAKERGVLEKYLYPSEADFVGILRQMIPEFSDLELAVFHRVLVASGHSIMFEYLTDNHPVDKIISENLRDAAIFAECIMIKFLESSLNL